MSPEAIAALVRDYGYWVVLLGTFFDHYGIPLFLVAGAIAAARGLLNIFGVFGCGFIGGWAADLFLYFLGYKTGLAYWMQFSFVKKAQKPVEILRQVFESRPVLLVVMGRFLFTVSKFIPPFVGMVRYPFRRYFVYSFAGNLLFSIAYTAAAYFVGDLLLQSTDKLKLVNIIATGAFLAALALLGRKLAKNLMPR